MLTLAITNEVRRNLEEPNNEHILRGSHEGLVERADTNLTLIRKRVNNPALCGQIFWNGQQANTKAYYLYMDGVIQPETLQEMEKRIADIKIDYFYSIGQLSDALEDSVLSPFPQLLNTSIQIVW